MVQYILVCPETTVEVLGLYLPRLADRDGSDSQVFSESWPPVAPVTIFIRYIAVQAKGILYFPSRSQNCAALDFKRSSLACDIQNKKVVLKWF